MKNTLTFITYVIIAALILVQCAKRGNPTGGPEDETPPVILRAYPDNYSTNFKNQTITIQFDEFVKFQDLTKQLVISPPLKTTPQIKPQGGASKKIEITITDTLKENTTYVMNFGQSIVDNNESNAYPFFKYVFSTGTYIDSLTLKGKISNALEYKTSDYVSVLLYEVDSTYTDSAIYKSSPNYVINTLDSLTTFTMENLKEGTYRMVALKEENSDLRFDSKRDMIGFVSEFIQIPTDQEYEVRLYNQIADKSLKRPTHESQNRIHVGYTGAMEGLKLNAVDASLIEKSRITKLEKKDTLQYWFQPTQKLDSILLKGAWNDYEEEFMIQLKDLKKDSLTVSKFGDFRLGKDIQLTGTTPIEKIDDSKIALIDRDSSAVSFTTKLDSLRNVATIAFTSSKESDIEKQENQQYTLNLFPGAITDFFGAVNPDTLKLNYSTRSTKDYGNVFIKIENGNDFPVVIQLVTTDLKVVAEQIADTDGTYNFFLVDPNTYLFRIVYDANKNGKYDPGNFLLQQQPERVQYLRREVQLKANWDVNETINLE